MAGTFPEANGAPIVAHSIRKFLPMSQNWIYPQVTELRRHRPVVMANYLLNAETFPVPGHVLHLIPRRHREWAEDVSRWLRLGRDTPSSWARALGPVTPRLIHSHFGNRGYFDLVVARRLRVPQVVTFYGHDLSRLPRDPVWKRRYARLFRSNALFTVEGTHMKGLLEALGCPASQIRLRRHGVDVQQFGYVPRQPDPDGIVKLLVAARFVEKKGIPYALRAVAEVMRAHPNVRLTLVGDAGPNDPEGAAIRQEVTELLATSPLRERTEWLGSVPFQRLMQLAVEHHIYIQASLHARDGDTEGGAPVTLIQLAATGMPIVATRHCDIPEIVLDDVTGALAPERDVEGLATALARIVSAPERWQQLGLQARRHIEEHFEMSKTIAALEAVYDEAVSIGR